ncbi:MAG: hypothetical protein J0I47_00375 [Sphingomonas sp.]|uniref:hypothetical protein n=1 Tax=Sphingomonas sp. TaxID=28214 RepID=UPI001AD2A02A|nr:hypothetical protein [Sphingomonas sp.]MBN8806683.1 hypothetical protein [Sphingomonas sp.]
MREPALFDDGWALRSGEEAHAAAPETFWIPDFIARRSLRIGDFAKLIFEISVNNEEDPVSVERMWVVVSEISSDRYFGLLDNEPNAIAENDAFWVGTEIPFGPEHVINIEPGDDASVALAAQEPLKKWSRN